MYTACVFCTADLGRNDVVEHFPVGRRLAFDAAKGLLWVVCPRCERWNLTPVEERWEAIEECERLYRGTRLRASTGNVGLARVADGTDLVRVGRPLRPELAAWRYGDQFGRRRRRAIAGSALGGAGAVGAFVGLPLLGIPGVAVGALTVAAGWSAFLLTMATGGAPLTLRSRWFRADDGEWLLVSPNELPLVRLVPEGDGGWGLRVAYRDKRPTRDTALRDFVNLPATGSATVTGERAGDVARTLLPLVNGRGASRAVVQAAVGVLDELGAGDEAFRSAARRVREIAARQSFGDTGALVGLPRDVRLALEMAAHEDVERRAMEGELAALERAWREAAELAGIAESLAEPPGIAARLEALRRRAGR